MAWKPSALVATKCDVKPEETLRKVVPWCDVKTTGDRVTDGDRARSSVQRGLKSMWLSKPGFSSVNPLVKPCKTW